ncbi:uncharacterized protein F5147DRAFT_781289 [Suillus discolor]|uniref:F-box domain-containing protein n=1 Tax=Suillus discolor TaxID=1912936 RepID=A0A9P7JLI8_9AGAM|nr:uncharacterized protein F5147DRAFT_781289 [Suillus discolor]KAG2087526.1 hypothetical protein F5147DRAFT_781289 [Suillus discolor]
MVNHSSIASLLCHIARLTKLGQKAPANKQNISQPINKEPRPAASCLPAELLSEIFMRTLPPFDELFPPSKLRSPMLLTRICRRWREVAVGTPGLWCRLFGRFMSSHCRHRKKESFCYDTWLKRSQGLPLSLEVMCFPNPLIGLLQHYTNQISSLRIVCCAATHDLLLNDLPALQVLTLDGQINYSQSKRSTVARSILNHSFTLRSLTVTGNEPSFYSADFDPFKNSRWTHLTDVNICVRQKNVLVALLQQAPNLSSVKIFIIDIHPEPPLPVKLCKHEKLQLLHIRSFEPFLSLPYMFNALSLPNLRNFIANEGMQPEWPHEEFKAFLARSKCPLEVLHFGSGMTETPRFDEQAAEYIALIPSLKVFPPRKCIR